MVAMNHGLCVSLCVCGETTKNKVGPKKHDGALELLGHLTVSDTYKEVKDGLKVTKCWCGVGVKFGFSTHFFGPNVANDPARNFRIWQEH